jgi:preprotein translocase subunit SecG
MVQNPKGGGLSSTRWISNVRWSTKNNRLLDKSTWTLATILIALILLSSFSFTGTLVILILKSLKTQEVQHQLQTRLLPLLQTHLQPQIQQNKLLYILKCQPVKFFYKKLCQFD